MEGIRFIIKKNIEHSGGYYDIEFGNSDKALYDPSLLSVDVDVFVNCENEKQSFIETLSCKLSSLGEIETGTLDESRWLNLTINQHHLSFCFDKTGNIINSISLYKDVLQVIDQEQIWKVFGKIY